MRTSSDHHQPTCGVNEERLIVTNWIRLAAGRVEEEVRRGLPIHPESRDLARTPDAGYHLGGRPSPDDPVVDRVERLA
jgi:hypothetical protein